MKAGHACEGCKYYFVGTDDETRSIYSGLQDAMVSVTKEVKQHMCSYAPGGVKINSAAPRCANYKEQEAGA